MTTRRTDNAHILYALLNRYLTRLERFQRGMVVPRETYEDKSYLESV